MADDADQDHFGTSISLQNGIAVAGAPSWDEAGNGGEGAFYGYTGLDSATSCNCPWDLNGDGTVSTTDLLALFAGWEYAAIATHALPIWIMTALLAHQIS